MNQVKKTFAIFKNRVQLQYGGKTFSETFDTEEECITFIKNIMGEEEYNKRELFAFNRNFKNWINDRLPQEQLKIWEVVCKKYTSSGGNKGRESHIEKNKTISEGRLNLNM